MPMHCLFFSPWSSGCIKRSTVVYEDVAVRNKARVVLRFLEQNFGPLLEVWDISSGVHSKLNSKGLFMYTLPETNGLPLKMDG